MIMFDNQSDKAPETWQQRFVEILPEIEQRLRHAFRRLNPESRDDAVEEGLVHCLLAFRRLHDQNRAESAFPSTLVHFAALHVRKGRQAACRMNSREPLSRYAQMKKDICVEPLQRFSAAQDQWIDLILEDQRSSVLDQVAARMDMRAWLAKLSLRTARIAKDLALGFATCEVAKKYAVTAGRVSQMRRELEQSWLEFQKESSTV